ncbi:MAG: TVP38/TMEM64 family protein [Rhodobacterales bacterium]|nr:TVP38/TMEM64 family protein [Rhodobacterales bacterium]
MNLARSGKMLVIAVVILAMLVVWVGQDAIELPFVPNGLSIETVQDWVAGAGLFGPLIVIVLMIIAVVASPLPSAPIALAAGAVFGHISGTIYVVIGAEAGALIAFGLGRWLGRDALLKWFGARVDMGLFGSQNALTAIVLSSRLMPFVSFDLVSYAAGLSCLHLWRFALATLAGIIPASFLLAHFGGEVASADMGATTWVVLGLGLISGLPLLVAVFHKKNNTSHSPKLRRKL